MGLRRFPQHQEEALLVFSFWRSGTWGNQDRGQLTSAQFLNPRFSFLQSLKKQPYKPALDNSKKKQPKSFCVIVKSSSFVKKRWRRREVRQSCPSSCACVDMLCVVYVLYSASRQEDLSVHADQRRMMWFFFFWAGLCGGKEKGRSYVPWLVWYKHPLFFFFFTSCCSQQEERARRPNKGSHRHNGARHRTGLSAEELPVPNCQPAISNTLRWHVAGAAAASRGAWPSPPGTA